MTPDQFVICIGQVESGNDPNVKPGDHGCAMGRFQVHPDWFDEWVIDTDTAAEEGDTWDSWVARIVRAFCVLHPGYGSLQLAMYYHLGHRSDPSKPDWDKVYAAKFTVAAAGIGAAL